MRLKSGRIRFGLIVFFMFLIGSWNIRQDHSTITGHPKAVDRSDGTTTLTHVRRVIDGDTIVIDNGMKVRYIGLDAPELSDKQKKAECFAAEAKEKNRNLVEGKTVLLTRDVSDKDRWGRLLRYVYVPGNPAAPLFVNQRLIEEGYASAETIPPDVSHSTVFMQLQENARMHSKGMWSSCR